jgi:hypothetical protein
MYHIRRKMQTATGRTVVRNVRSIGYTLAD